MSKPPLARCRTTGWPACNAVPRCRGSLMGWLDPGFAWQVARSGRTVRPVVCSDAVIQFCVLLKCMFGPGLRQATDLAESLALAGSARLKRAGDSTPPAMAMSLCIACHHNDFAWLVLAYRTAGEGLDPQRIHSAGHARNGTNDAAPSGVRVTAALMLIYAAAIFDSLTFIDLDIKQSAMQQLARSMVIAKYTYAPGTENEVTYGV